MYNVVPNWWGKIITFNVKPLMIHRICCEYMGNVARNATHHHISFNTKYCVSMRFNTYCFLREYIIFNFSVAGFTVSPNIFHPFFKNYWTAGDFQLDARKTSTNAIPTFCRIVLGTEEPNKSRWGGRKHRWLRKQQRRQNYCKVSNIRPPY